MDPEFNSYFTRRISGQAHIPVVFAEEIRFLADVLGQQKGWRSDAKYFLFYNVFFMLLAPLRGVNDQRYIGPFSSSGNIVIDPELRDALQSDLHTVAERARRIANQRGREYVSSTSVAMALGEVAEELKTSDFRVWGRARGVS